MGKPNGLYALRFELVPQRSEELILGKLHLLKEGAIVNTYTATSSIRGRQYSRAWELKGGLIPPNGLILPDGQCFLVATQAIFMPDVKGVEGSFYAITPFEMQTRGVVRGDFGIHYDANIPGSMGCVVLSTQRGWDAFRRDVKSIAVQGFKFLELDISYEVPK
jgi:hypothetical protein